MNIHAKNYYRPANYQYSPAYYSMNNLRSDNINNLDPFGGKARRSPINLNNPGYTNQFGAQALARGGAPAPAPGVQFSRVNLGVPMVNLHQGKKQKIVVLGVQNLDPSRSVFQGNVGGSGTLNGGVGVNAGFPQGGAGSFPGPGMPGGAGFGSGSGGGMAPGMGGRNVAQTVAVAKPLMVSAFFLAELPGS